MVIVAGSHPNKNVRGWSAAQGEKKKERDQTNLSLDRVLSIGL
jgi:hypothetical protein